MNKRTREQWHQLFTDWEASGLSQARFCKQHKLCPKYFSLRRRQLADKPIPVRVPTGLVKVQPPASSSAPRVSLHYQGIEVRFAHAAPHLIADVVKQLV